MAGWMINCKEYASLISQSLDQSTSLWEKVSMKMHQIFCPFCKQIQLQFDTIRGACRFTPDDEALADVKEKRLSDEACEQIKSALHKIIIEKDR